ncbi:MAG: hypothetical protein KF760_29210 [Candidatus Eremiobacteraeota bacterium]|nr:hypothetical protein [Candidatus Eremiobacteraeota bacterium]MCW5865947.1 hypothetical protein [Candidatus Eremiobacteraeota bacterium]
MIRSMLLTLLLTAAVGAQTVSQRLKIEVSVLTRFAHDRGAMPYAVLYQGKQYSLAEAAGAILPHFGWADPANRVELALAWVKAVDLAGLTPRQEPKVQSLPEGGVEVGVWVRLPTGNHPAAYGYYRFIFNAAGQEKSEVGP